MDAASKQASFTEIDWLAVKAAHSFHPFWKISFSSTYTHAHAYTHICRRWFMAGIAFISEQSLSPWRTHPSNVATATKLVLKLRAAIPIFSLALFLRHKSGLSKQFHPTVLRKSRFSNQVPWQFYSQQQKWLVPAKSHRFLLWKETKTQVLGGAPRARKLMDTFIKGEATAVPKSSSSSSHQWQ